MAYWLRFGLRGLCASAIALGACGPKIDTGSDDAGTGGTGFADASATAPSTTTAASTTTTGDDADDDIWEPDIPSTTGGSPMGCAPDAYGLELVWQAVDGTRERAESVSVLGDVVAWTAAGFDGTALRVQDTASAEELWYAATEFWVGEGDLTLQDVAVTDDGVVLGGTVAGLDGFSIGVRWFANDGALVNATDSPIDSTALFGGVAHHQGATVVATSMFDAARMVGYEGQTGWETFWGHDTIESEFARAVAVDSTGNVYVTGHINTGPVSFVLMLSPDGELVWSIINDEPPGEYGTAVAIDDHDRAIVGSTLDQVGVLRRYGPQAVEELEVIVDQPVHGVAVDAAGRIVVVGHDYGSSIFVERRDEDGALLEAASFDGSVGLDVAVDDACHVYVVGESSGAWLAKLQ